MSHILEATKHSKITISIEAEVDKRRFDTMQELVADFARRLNYDLTNYYPDIYSFKVEIKDTPIVK